MFKRSIAALFAIIFLASSSTSIYAELVTTRDGKWSSVVTGSTLDMKILEPKGFDLNKPAPLIVYLENLSAPRVGTDSDEVIIGDFLKDGFLVIILDYAGNPQSRVPTINRDLFEIRNEVLNKTFISGYDIDPARVFIVPAGSRMISNVVYYREPKRTLAMDIIAPTHPKQPTGVVLEFSCDNLNRMGDGSLAICSDTILDGEAIEGFGVAMADHPVSAPYKGLDPMPDCAWKIKAAVRTLRTEGAKLGLNGRVGCVGFSRGSGMALMLATTMGMKEFEGYGVNTNASSDVQAAVVMSGRFTYLDLLPNDKLLSRYAKAWGDRSSHQEIWRREGALDYLQAPTVPLFLTINCSEGPDAQHQMMVLRKRLAELGNDDTFMMDPDPRGHKVTLVPQILSAMNDYLKQNLEGH